MAKHSHTTARLEKKVSKNAKELLLALFPHFKAKDFSLEEGDFTGYRGDVFHQQWHVWFGPDYFYGDYDSEDCYWILYSWLIDNTTDFEGMSAAQEENDWQEDTDLEPFYSPWRGASRAEVISHCRDLVKAGVTLERMR
ncbi:hypothetical protein [Kosakonia sp. R1.Fl]|uniref:hypothetical protein n=1 Tax=Kosakonia sp. R1.Fl TaxID=2928706 RepID=UPI00201D8D1E|nr:hypothetical protein [Kosakonia sp. R1.Fl]MCL6745085.1 hypothetical protein [Kosakonia sp. R1.Fl]